MKKFIAFGLAAVLMSFAAANVSNAEETSKNSVSSKKVENAYRCNPNDGKDRAVCYGENQGGNGNDFRCGDRTNNRTRNVRGCCQR